MRRARRVRARGPRSSTPTTAPCIGTTTTTDRSAPCVGRTLGRSGARSGIPHRGRSEGARWLARARARNARNGSGRSLSIPLGLEHERPPCGVLRGVAHGRVRRWTVPRKYEHRRGLEAGAQERQRPERARRDHRSIGAGLDRGDPRRCPRTDNDSDDPADPIARVGGLPSLGAALLHPDQGPNAAGERDRIGIVHDGCHRCALERDRVPPIALVLFVRTA